MKYSFSLKYKDRKERMLQTILMDWNSLLFTYFQQTLSCLDNVFSLATMDLFTKETQTRKRRQYKKRPHFDQRWLKTKDKDGKCLMNLWWNTKKRDFKGNQDIFYGFLKKKRLDKRIRKTLSSSSWSLTNFFVITNKIYSQLAWTPHGLRQKMF